MKQTDRRGICFSEHNFAYLPVVVPPERNQVVGLLKLDDVLSAYQQRLVKERPLQFPLGRKGDSLSR